MVVLITCGVRVNCGARAWVDIGAWLREQGLERYDQALQKGEIDPEVPPGLLLVVQAQLTGFGSSPTADHTTP